jgi:hypothetical protein
MLGEMNVPASLTEQPEGTLLLCAEVGQQHVPAVMSTGPSTIS